MNADTFKKNVHAVIEMMIFDVEFVIVIEYSYRALPEDAENC